MSVYFASLRGLRKSNEDAHTIFINHANIDKNYSNINLYGVYDGHGGKFVSNFLSKNLPIFFISKKTIYPLTKEYVTTVYNKIQDILFTKFEKESLESGSTCLIVSHFKNNGTDYLNIINTGDSRCVLCNSNNIAIALTKDHKPDWPDEYARIAQAGGNITFDDSICRIGSLSVSRAFGDKDEARYVTHVPDIFLHTLNHDKFIIVACDGLWDVMCSQTAVNFVLQHCYDVCMVRINKTLNISRKIAEKCIDLGSSDNITCIIVFFDYQ